MTFSVFIPDHALGEGLPVISYLTGLACTHANVTDKGEYRAACAELGLIFVAPDTSPRSESVLDDPAGAYDLGLGVSFYVDATEAPYAANYGMWSYVTEELPGLISEHFPVAPNQQAIMGHSMGGHPALTIALSLPKRYRSVSAFHQSLRPRRSRGAKRRWPATLGDDQVAWRSHDTVTLIRDGARVPAILVDQCEADDFLPSQLMPELLADACGEHGIDLTLNMRPGYDHSYHFISTFKADQLRWNARKFGESS